MTGPAQRLPVTGVILAGGRGLRMGGRDKGLVEINGRALIAHVIEAFVPQVDELIIIANRNIPAYEAFGYAVVADEVAGFQGPLAGMLTGLQHATHEYIASVPCDTLTVPPDLVARLWQSAGRQQSDICVAHDGEYLQPVYALLNKCCSASLANYLESGKRKTADWMEMQGARPVDFPGHSDLFQNINSL